MRIWKYPLTVTDVQYIKMPLGAKPLSVQLQNELPQLWVLCDEHAPKTLRTFAIHGTGHEVPRYPGIFIGTFQIPAMNGGLVFHVFERPL